MPRIDPQQLLKCLSVLLTPKGGMKSKDEVQRLASLMTKFSKKLVSKCIYVCILRATEADLLSMFMSAGGWDLTFSWLTDGVAAKNWPLVTELVDLLLVCPVDIDRLKTNACPKLIKTLSKDNTADEKVRLLACKLVERWLRIVRGDNDVPTSRVAEQAPGSSQQFSVSSSPVSSAGEPDHSETPVASSVDSGNLDNTSDGHLPVYKITIRDGKQVLAEISGDRRSSSDIAEEDCSTGTEDVAQEEEGDRAEQIVEDSEGSRIENAEDDYDDNDEDEEELIKPVKIKKKTQAKTSKQSVKKPAKVHSGTKKDRDSSDSSSSTSTSKMQNKLKDNVKPDKKKGKLDIITSKISPKSKTTLKVKENDVTKTNAAGKDLEETSSKPKEKFNLSLKNKKTFISNKDKSDSKFEKKDAKDKLKFDDLSEKEKETLSKFMTPPISKLGKIPKKASVNKEEKQSEEKNRTLKDENFDTKAEIKKGIDLKKPEIKRPDRNFSISVEPKRSALSDGRPKTVKTYNSKFRSTGLEEEVKPPPPRIAPKKSPLPPFMPLTPPEKKLGKRTSPPPEPPIPEKKAKPESPVEDKKPIEKVGGIKLIPPKPKAMFLQESDVFMDAMLAANTMKEPRKRKRKVSISKETGPSESKREAGGNNSPNHSPKNEDASPSSVKPTFKFYQETLETSLEDDKADIKLEDSEYGESNMDDLVDDQKSMSSEDDKASIKAEGINGPVKGVLVNLKTRRQKKSVSWKEDGLESIRYFDLDETERVNVTKNFADMKNMERENERENLQIARKLAVDDIMEERIRWKALIPIDTGAAVVAPGKSSQEKDIQYAREKTVAPAIYFNRRTIPDSAAEPDLEIHATTDPVIIPLDDITGSTDSITDFTNTPWPDPKGQPPAVAAPLPPPTQPPVPTAFPPGPAPGPPGPGPAPFPPGPYPHMAPFMPGPVPPVMPMAPPGDCWRGADGKVVPMPPEMYQQGMMPPPGMQPMGPGPMMLPPGVTPDMSYPMAMPGPNPSPEEMAHFGGGFPPMGPTPTHQMFNPPLPPPGSQGPQGGNFQGSGGNWQDSAGGSWYDNEQPPPNQGSGGRYQGNNNNSWRGGRNNRNPENWGGGGGNSRTRICHNFLKRGFCRNSSCRFFHPR